MQPNIIERVWRQDKMVNVDVLNGFTFLRFPSRAWNVNLTIHDLSKRKLNNTFSLY